MLPTFSADSTRLKFSFPTGPVRVESCALEGGAAARRLNQLATVTLAVLSNAGEDEERINAAVNRTLPAVPDGFALSQASGGPNEGVYSISVEVAHCGLLPRRFWGSRYVGPKAEKERIRVYLWWTAWTLS
jgi:hypothetical protein